MKRIATFSVLLLMAAGLFAQPFTGVSWVGWDSEPDYDGVVGYMDNPYDNPVVSIKSAPDGITPGSIADATSFDAAWAALGDSMAISNLTSNGVAGDLFDLDGAATFGAAWKGVHDGSNFYVLLKYWDTNSQADDGSLTFEIVAQPTSFDYDTATYNMYTRDSADNANLVAYQNMAFARYVELGGGKAVFSDGQVSEYAASIGLGYDKKAWIAYTTGSWGSNDHGLLGLAMGSHYWEKTDGVIRAMMVMSFDGALGYPVDPTDLDGDFNAVKVGDTIAFDVKSNSTVGGSENDNKVEYFWSSDVNNGYASNYYSGHVVFEAAPPEPGEALLTGVSWVGWDSEPAYDGVVGYMDNPYDNPEVDILEAPEGWEYSSISDAAGFDATWDILGDSMAVMNLTSNGVAGDINDLDGAGTFGAAWKGVHDGSNFYVLIKYYDINSQVDDGSRTFEICAQPTSYIKHDYSYDTYTADSAANDNLIAYQNMAYGRYVELGGGKAVFSDGLVGEYAASIGLGYDKKAWINYTTGSWGSNDHGLLGLAMASHFWNVDDAGTIRAVMVMSFDGALGYPADPNDMEGDYLALQVGETIAFDVKSNSTIGGTENDNKVEYFWSADVNNGYASNYYSGHVTMKDEQIVIGATEDHYAENVKVYMYNENLYIKGIELTNVKVYSITGALMKSVENVSGQLNLEDLNDGIYLIKLDGVSTGFKVVK